MVERLSTLNLTTGLSFSRITLPKPRYSYIALNNKEYLECWTRVKANATQYLSPLLRILTTKQPSATVNPANKEELIWLALLNQPQV